MKNQLDRIKISQEEFDDMYEIENIEDLVKVTNDLKEIITAEEPKEETVLSEEEQTFDDKLAETYNYNEESSTSGDSD